MCSEAAFKSDHVIRELYLAADFKKPLIAILLDTSEIPDEAKYFVTGYPRIAASVLSQADLTSNIGKRLKGESRLLTYYVMARQTEKRGSFPTF